MMLRYEPHSPTLFNFQLAVNFYRELAFKNGICDSGLEENIMEENSRREVLRNLTAGTATIAGFASSAGAASQRRAPSQLPVNITDAPKDTSRRVQTLALNSDAYTELVQQLHRDLNVKVSVGETEVKNVEWQETPTDDNSPEPETFSIVSIPLSFESKRTRGRKRRQKSATDSQQTKQGDIAVKVQNNEVIEVYASVSEQNQDGLVKSMTTYHGDPERVGLQNSNSKSVSSATHEVFNEENELVLDAQAVSDASADKSSQVQAQHNENSTVCKFCMAVGNVICTVGCGVAYAAIVASVAVAPPASLTAGAVVSAFCGLVTLANEAANGNGCGVDWTTEGICEDLYNDCEDESALT